MAGFEVPDFSRNSLLDLSQNSRNLLKYQIFIVKKLDLKYERILAEKQRLDLKNWVFTGFWLKISDLN